MEGEVLHVAEDPNAKLIKMDLLTKGEKLCAGAMNSMQSKARLISEESCAKKSIHDLPDELLCLVFSFLGLRDLVLGAKRVCQRWKAVADDNSIWKKRILYYSIGELKDTLDIVKESPNLRHVGFYSTKPSGLFFKVIAEHCMELRGIRAYGITEESVDGVEAVVEQCPKLEYVVIQDELPNPRNFLQLVGKCRNLKKLHVNIKTPVTGIFDSVIEGCPMLQSLNVMYSVYRRPELSLFLEKKGHQLTELYFSCCFRDADRHCILSDIVRCCRRLEILGIHYHEGSFQSLYEFFECGNAQNLRDLSLFYFSTNEELCTSAFQHAPNLTFLKILCLKFRDKHMEGIGKLSNLRVLKLPTLLGPSDEAVRNITRCKKLKSLFLPNFKGTDENFVTFCKELPHLEEAYLFDTVVTAKSLLLVPDNLRNLQVLCVLGEGHEEAVLSIKCRMPFLDICVYRNKVV